MSATLELCAAWCLHHPANLLEFKQASLHQKVLYLNDRQQLEEQLERQRQAAELASQQLQQEEMQQTAKQDAAVATAEAARRRLAEEVQRMQIEERAMSRYLASVPH